MNARAARGVFRQAAAVQGADGRPVRSNALAARSGGGSVSAGALAGRGERTEVSGGGGARSGRCAPARSQLAAAGVGLHVPVWFAHPSGGPRSARGQMCTYCPFRPSSSWADDRRSKSRNHDFQLFSLRSDTSRTPPPAETHTAVLFERAADRDLPARRLRRRRRRRTRSHGEAALHGCV